MLYNAINAHSQGISVTNQVESPVLPALPKASTKVYHAKQDGRAAVQRLDAVVEDGGLLVVAPDPLVPFANSQLERIQHAGVVVLFPRLPRQF